MSTRNARPLSSHSGENSGVLVLRAWLEDGSPHRLRVRIIQLHHHGEPLTTAAATVEATCAIVRTWLNELLEAKPTP